MIDCFMIWEEILPNKLLLSQDVRVVVYAPNLSFRRSAVWHLFVHSWTGPQTPQYKY